MKTNKSVVSKKINEQASEFYKKYNIISDKQPEVLKPNGNYKYVWDFKASSKNTITTSIY